MSGTLFREGYAIRDQFATYFLTLTVCGWIDLFTRKVYKDIVIDALKYAQSKNQLLLYAYVIMSNHIHMIAAANEKQKKGLSDIIRDFKKFTHNTIMPVVESEIESRREWMLHQFTHYGKVNPKNESRQIWTNNNHPEECYSRDFLNTKLLYTHENPVRAGIVRNAEDYVYSSASNYAGLGGIIDVIFI
jgi:REP element-mobilizing transposase RayT